MTSAEHVIDRILAASDVPSERRRRDIARELRAHLEDFFENERQGGLGDEEIERVLLERFGDAKQVARQFALVYRRERAWLHLATFLLSTLVVSLLIAAAAIPLHAGVMLSFGMPKATVFESRHTMAVALNILASAGTYLGLLALEKEDRRLPIWTWALVAILFVLLLAVGSQAGFLLFGLINGVFLRVLALRARRAAWRLLGTLVCFAGLGSLLFHPTFSALPATSASWLVMGLGYFLLTYVAERVDQAVQESLSS